MSEVDDAAAGPRSRRHAAQNDDRSSRPLWVELVVLLVIAFLVAFVVRTFLLGVYFIPSGSMENTLRIGDRVVVDKVSYRLHDVRRGDIVVFNGVDSFTPEGEVATTPTNPVARTARRIGALVGAAPASERDFIKRVVGVPGDRVVCCDPSGRITVTPAGTTTPIPLDEPYLFPGDAPSSERFNIVVPPGRLWVMGDHRSASADSRAHLGDPGGGTVPANRVIGRARFVVWPFPHVKRLPTPATFGGPLGEGPPPAPALASDDVRLAFRTEQGDSW